MDFLLLAVGLAILVGGGEATVRGAVGLAGRVGLSPAVVGLTVVAFGTSAPELVVSVEAARTGSPDIAIGNVVGSNIANALLILGIGALIAPLVCEPRAVRRDGTAMVVSALLLCVLGLSGAIVLWQGAAMVVALALFVAWSCYRDIRTTDGPAGLHAHIAEDVHNVPQRTWLIALYVLGGLAALVYGAGLFVDSAVSIARRAGLSEAVIGLSLVAVGTSLPELAATAIAAWRRHTDVAIGNVIGSNIFNIMGILGISAMVAPLPFDPHIVRIDLWVMLAAAFVLLPVIVSGWRIVRLEAGLLLLLYVAYIASLWLRHT